MDEKNNKDRNKPEMMESRLFIKHNIRDFEKMFEGFKYKKMTIEQARELLDTRLGKQSLSETVIEERNS